METDGFLLEAAIAAFESARDGGHELRECLRAVLNVAAPPDVSGPGMGLVSFVEPNPGEKDRKSRCGTQRHPQLGNGGVDI